MYAQNYANGLRRQLASYFKSANPNQRAAQALPITHMYELLPTCMTYYPQVNTYYPQVVQYRLM